MSESQATRAAGGGVAGPVAALRKAGIEATIYEGYPDTADGMGGMLMLAPNGLDALRVVGVDASALGQSIQRMVIGDGSGTRFGEFPGVLAIESTVERARCLRDLPDLPMAFAAYEHLRRPRVENIAAYAAKQNNNKTVGPVARALMSIVMPLTMKTFLNPEKTFGWMHGYHIEIEWDRDVAA